MAILRFMILQLDLSNYSLTNVTNMQNMFNKMTNLASMQVSNQFVVVANSNGIFDNTNSLKAIIVSNKIPKAGAFTNVKDSLSSNVKFYVPTEEAYEKSWANDFGKERIEPILQLVGKTPIRANINETYQDAGYLVAGFEMEKAELYNCYGYTVTMLNTVDTSKEQTQTLTYRISRTYQSGAETIQEDLMDATREIKVVDLDKYMITEWNVSGDAGLEITLPVRIDLIVDCLQTPPLLVGISLSCNILEIANIELPFKYHRYISLTTPDSSPFTLSPTPST